MKKEPTLEIDNFDTKQWFLHGKRHRIDGPAIEYANGGKSWFLHGKRHRVDGPAVEWVSGDKSWWLNDEYYSFEDWKIKVREYYETDEDYLLMLLKLD